MALQLSPTQLHLAVASFQEKVDWLDSEYRRLRLMAEEADAYTLYYPELETNRVMRRTYAAMVAVIETELRNERADRILAVGA